MTANSESTELYKDAKKYLMETNRFLNKLEVLVADLVLTKSRYESGVTPASLLEGRLKSIHDVRPLFEEFKVLQKKHSDSETRFLEIGKQEKTCRKTLFYRTRHLVAKLEKAKLCCYHLFEKFVVILLHLVSAVRPSSPSSEDWLYALEIVETFNQFFNHDSSLCNSRKTLLHSHYNKKKHIHENFCPPSENLREITVSNILNILATERSWEGAVEFTKSITLGLEKRQIALAAEDVEWLTIPAQNLPVDPKAFSVYQISSGKGTDGTRKNLSPDHEGSPTSDYFSQNGGGARNGGQKKQIAVSSGTHFAIIEELITSEEIFLNNFFKILAQVPGLLAIGILKNSGKKEKPVICKYVRQQMAEFYHDVLWQVIGQLTQGNLLWHNLPQYIYVPYAFQHPRICLGIANMLQENLYAKLGDGYPPLAFPAMQIVVESLSIHVISVSWDLQFLSCISESTRPKTVVVPMDQGSCGTQASKTGKLIYDTLKVLVRLNNRCRPDMLRDFVEHGAHDPEDFPFLEELHILRRLHATLFCLRNWATNRAHATLQSWQIKDFLLITQNDLLNAQEGFALLQITDHGPIAMAKSLSIQLFTHIQHVVSSDVSDCQRSIRMLPITNQDDMARVCRTFSLATLQNIFPGPKHWKASHGSLPQKHSDYVNEFIDRVLAPVIIALAEMTVPIQKNIGRIVVKTFCEAWLEHIRTSKIKFSDWGAKQLNLDFTALRQWIAKNNNLKDNSRRYLLLLDSIRQCEGVAKLLLSKQGELVEVKPNKNRVAPMDEIAETQNRPVSPVNQILDAIPAELYVPDQQQWIDLKTNSKFLSLPFCCR